MDRTIEQKLVARALGGDTAAFEVLLADVLVPSHRFATALLHDAGLAEDAVQDASLLAWRKLRRLAPGRPFRPWFLGIVANRCREQLRGRWWQLIRIPLQAAVTEETPEQAAVTRAQLREALMKLSDRQRQVLALRIYLELPWSDVAAVAQLSEAGARTAYYRALERVRRVDAGTEVTT